jgi:hypothetical protein
MPIDQLQTCGCWASVAIRDTLMVPAAFLKSSNVRPPSGLLAKPGSRVVLNVVTVTCCPLFERIWLKVTFRKT